MSKRRPSIKQLKGIQLRQYTGFVFFSCFVLLFLLAFFVDHRLVNQQQTFLIDEAVNRFESAVSVVENYIEKHTQFIEVLSLDETAMRLLEAQDREGLNKHESLILSRFPQISKIRILQKVDAEDLVMGRSNIIHRYGKLSFAEIDLIRKATLGQTQQALEMHRPGSDEQSLVIVRNYVKDSVLLGHLLVFFHSSEMVGYFKSIDMGRAFFELRQYSDSGNYAVLSNGGNVMAKTDGALLKQAINGARWTMFLWPPRYELDFQWRFTNLSGFLLIALLLAITLIRINLRLQYLIRSDLERVTLLVRDLWKGQRGGTYPVYLSLFQGAIDAIIKLSTENLRHNSLARMKKKSKVDFQYDETTTAQLDIEDKRLAIKNQDNSKIPSEIFRAYDIRGTTDILVPEVARQIGKAIGSEALERGHKTLVIGRDGRLSSPDLCRALISGIRSVGCNVISIGLVPTPLTYYATHLLETGAGVMLTGSHNPGNYNGFKIVLDGGAISGEMIQALRYRIEANKFSTGEGSLVEKDVSKEYMQTICDDVRLSRPMHVVVDAGNGAAGEVGPALLKKLGCRVESLYCEIDGNFPNHHPDPSQPKNLMDLIAAVKSNKADLGIAFDGDGDRLGLITSEGMIIWPDRQMMLFAKDVLSRNPGGEIVYDVKCTRHLAKVITDNGGKATMWKTGHSLIKSKLRESGALLAGEMSGHIFFKERWYGFDDALYSAARLLEILSKESASSHKIFASLPDSVNTPELNVKLKEGEHFRFMDKLVDEAQFDDAKVITIDGLRVEFEYGWGLVRASNTTPTLVLRFEADSEDNLQKIQNRFRELLLKVDDQLDLPF